MQVAASEGYRLWSTQYDHDPNPLLALEMRVLQTRLGPLEGRRFLDVATGTGRWMAYARSQGAEVFGIDLSPDMLAEAAMKPYLAGRLILADMRRLPLRSDSADLVVCSFALGYVRRASDAFKEMARVAPRVIVSDLHYRAIEEGWTRSFRMGGESYELDHFLHPIEELEDAAQGAGLMPEWRIDAHFGEQEREIFERAGKPALFEGARKVPAVLLMCWSKP